MLNTHNQRQFSTVMGKFGNHTTKTNIMKKQNQFVQAMKCCLTNGKFALLLFSSILLFTSCGNSLSRSKAEKLKSYIDSGKKFVAVSSIIKPEKVE